MVYLELFFIIDNYKGAIEIMQYHLTDNITSNSIKGSAIFGVFSDKSTKVLTGLVGKLDIAKITDTFKKSSFEGKIKSKADQFEPIKN